MKRIIICLDGTGNTIEPLNRRGKDYSTNVLRLARMIPPIDTQGVHQIILYLPGVGTNGSYDRCVNGIRGRGVEFKLLIAYQFITDNYLKAREEEDDIYLFGFSRGAFTARLLASFLDIVRVIPKDRMHEFDRIYDAYKQLMKTGDMSPEDKEYFGEGFKDLSERDEQNEYKRIPIRFLGVWDTVTTLLGNVEEVVPPDGRSLMERLKDGIKGLSATTQNFFTNTSDSNEDKIGHQTISELPGIVTKAYQALALHEIRTTFPPALWTGPEGSKRFTQVWFPGSHSDIGGGYENNDLSNVTLEWMIGQATREGLYVKEDKKIGPRNTDPPSPRFLTSIYESCGDFLFDWFQLSVQVRTFGQAPNEYRHASVGARRKHNPNPSYSHQYGENFIQVDQKSDELDDEPIDSQSIDQKSLRDEIAAYELFAEAKRQQSEAEGMARLKAKANTKVIHLLRKKDDDGEQNKK